MARELRGRVVLLTGGTSGIGRVATARLARRGACVVTCARDAERLRTVVAGLPGEVHGVACDLVDADDREQLVQTVIDRHGRLDALVNNAGVGRVGPLMDLDAASIEQMVTVNLTAVADLTRLALPHLRRAGGDIVMLSSAAAWAPIPPLALYSATKAGVDGLVTALRREVPRDVRIHSVNPGPVRTEWLARAFGARPDEDDSERKLSFGVPPEWVAVQIEKCLTAYHSRSAAVPHLLGLARLTRVPPVGRVLDALIAPLAPSLARRTREYGRRIANRR
ncbi:SDR family oxidoreductase [Pseudonocardia nigra]|uniref:SDR family oxidoreductase n=1 Tax=Pseudonocardia nigra TaxID=1921578 RepID=UPI001C5E0801|nr:SDR family oxidoreductase [Pseudonocardia nigra]